MKRIYTLHAHKTYISSDGTVCAYFHELDLADALGQAKALRVQVVGHRRSTNSTRATIRFFESAMPGACRPRQWGKEIGSGTPVVTLRPDLFDITGPFLGRVECVLEIDDSLGQDDPQEFELEVHVTAILEE